GVRRKLGHRAGRHSPRDAPITVGARLAGPETIEVSVTEHGPGVSPGHRDEIFAMFVRRDNDAGAGLGLTIARTFVEAHGQRIWGEDAPGGGARVCFRLPAAASVAEDRA